MKIEMLNRASADFGCEKITPKMAFQLDRDLEVSTGSLGLVRIRLGAQSGRMASRWTPGQAPVIGSALVVLTSPDDPARFGTDQMECLRSGTFVRVGQFEVRGLE